MSVKFLEPRLIKPWAHQVFLEGKTSPYYVDCTMETCQICRKVDCAKNMKMIDELIKELFGT